MAINLDDYLKKLQKWNKKEANNLLRNIEKEYERLIEKVSDLIQQAEEEDDTMKINKIYPISQDIHKSYESMANERNPMIKTGLEECYIQNHAYYAYSVGKVIDSLVSYAYPKADTIKAIINNDLVKMTLDETLEKQRADITLKIKDELTRGAYRGSRYSDIAKRIEGILGQDQRKSMLIVRTEMHRVAEKGQTDSSKEQQDQGVIQTKKWNTVEDERVRSLHREMDGVAVNVEEEFTMPDGVKGESPGNIGVARHDCNCRCFLTYSVEDIEKESYKGFNRIPPYETWKKRKEEEAKALQNSSIMMTNFINEIGEAGNKKYIALVEKNLKEAPEFARNLWNSKAHLIKIDTTTHRGVAGYNTGLRNIRFNIAEDKRSRGAKKPTQTVFHELGHLFDFSPCEKSYERFSRLYKDGHFDYLLQKETDAFIKKKLAEKGYTRDSDLGRAYVNDYLFGKYYADCSDIIEGVTLADFHGAYGHGLNYWLRADNDPSLEAFAEFYSATLSDPDSLKGIKEIFPESYEFFIEMCEELAKL